MEFCESQSDRYKRECSVLRETVSRLEEDCRTLKEREQKDRQTIQSLLEEMERKDTEFRHEVTVWRDKYGALQAQIMALVLEKTVDSDHEGGDAGSVDKGKKRPAPTSERPGKKHSGSPSKKRGNLTAAKGVESQIPSGSKNRKQKVDGCQFSAKGVRGYRQRNFGSKSTCTGRIPSSEQVLHAVRRAEILQSSLKTWNASFIRPMRPSHVSGGFWLGLPRQFCQDNLPAHQLEMTLEDENGLESAVNYICQRTALSGGWRGFALNHNLEIGDVLIFELRDPARFKVYIIKAIPEEAAASEVDDGRIGGRRTNGTNKRSKIYSTENHNGDQASSLKKPLKAGIKPEEKFL